ncbi:MAG: NAD(P)/FAD-dependent oxidoreductase [Saprospiraceae bacterium]
MGGGAAGFFAAIRHKETFPEHEVTVFEKTTKVLGKVKISGGGRCNVTHACFNVKDLIQYYPRGGKELQGAFYRFQPSDTIQWFEARGVLLKTEEDGRMFPITNKSETIMDCLTTTAQALGVRLLMSHSLSTILCVGTQFELKFSNDQQYLMDQLILTSGSGQLIWDELKKLGHHICAPVPSLFTFNISDERLIGLPGISWPLVEITLPSLGIKSTGPLLITHWGLSGPAILKLSAFGAVAFHDIDYKFEMEVNYAYPLSANELKESLLSLKEKNKNKLVINTPIPGFTSRVWQIWMSQIGMGEKLWQSVSLKDISSMIDTVTSMKFKVDGKSTFKEEFVTCGGVDLKEVDMRSMQSKLIPGLYFAGEVLNIDALTGGFNFQAAWTTGWLAGSNG